jgi:hypothetical protein
MTRLTVVIGSVLVVLGVVAYAATAAASVTALIPSFVGVLLLICAAVARKPAWHRHGIHAALVVALLGALGTLMNVARIGEVFAGTAERPAAVIVSTLMFVVLVGYIVMGMRSFIAARRSRTGSGPTARS